MFKLKKRGTACHFGILRSEGEGFTIDKCRITLIIRRARCYYFAIFNASSDISNKPSKGGPDKHDSNPPSLGSSVPSTFFLT